MEIEYILLQGFNRIIGSDDFRKNKNYTPKGTEYKVNLDLNKIREAGL